MNLPRRKLLLVLPIVLLAVAGIWITISHRGQPPESETGWLTEDERDDLMKYGILVLPDAQNVTRSSDTVSPVSEIVVYELPIRIRPASAARVIATSLEEMGWREGVRTYNDGDWLLVYRDLLSVGLPTDSSGRSERVFVKTNARRSLLVCYELDIRREAGPTSPPVALVIRATSVKRSPLTPTPTPKRRPIS